MRARALPALLLAALSPACRSRPQEPPPEAAPSPSRPPAERRGTSMSMPIRHDFAPGFDALEPGGGWREHDHEGPAGEWTIRREIETQGLGAYSVVRDNRDGRLVVTSAKVPEVFLSRGVYSACRALAPAAVHAGSAVSEEEAEELLYARGGLWTFFHIVRRNDALAPILKRVIAKPSLLSVLLRRGVEVEVDLFHERVAPAARDLPEPVGRIQGFELPFRISLNAEPALEGTLTAVPPDPPFRICSGILALEARRPGTERRLVIELVGARLGRAPLPAQPGR